MGYFQDNTNDAGELKGYVAKHMIVGVLLAVLVIIVLKFVLGYIDPPQQTQSIPPDLKRRVVATAAPEDVHKDSGQPAHAP